MLSLIFQGKFYEKIRSVYKSHCIKKVFIEKTRDAACSFVRIRMQRLCTINLSQSKSFSRRLAYVRTRSGIIHVLLASKWPGPPKLSGIDRRLGSSTRHPLRRSTIRYVELTHDTTCSREVCTCNPSREGASMKFKTLARSDLRYSSR